MSQVHYLDKPVVTNTHDAGYRLIHQTYGNGLTRAINYSREDNLRSSDIVYNRSQALKDLSLSYNYAADKQITAENIVGDLIKNTSFTAQYDAGNRITSWNRPNASLDNAQTWNYDASGNWKSTTKTNGNQSTTEARKYSAADKITKIGSKAAKHDAKGNLTQYEQNGKRYIVSYDLDNRITTAKVGSSTVTYRYDALGRRVIRKQGATKSALIWWGNSECAEHKHAAGQTVIQNDIMSHPTRLNSVIARAVKGSKYKLSWYHKNYLDHVYAVSNKKGDLIEHYRYSAFGEAQIYDRSGVAQAKSQINNQIMWNTRRLDPVTGYYLYKYRHYSPELGRWPSRDPIEESGGVNLYAFVGNDGVNRWDRLGNQVNPQNPPEVLNGPVPPLRKGFKRVFDCVCFVDGPCKCCASKEICGNVSFIKGKAKANTLQGAATAAKAEALSNGEAACLEMDCPKKNGGNCLFTGPLPQNNDCFCMWRDVIQPMIA